MSKVSSSTKAALAIGKAAAQGLGIVSFFFTNICSLHNYFLIVFRVLLLEALIMYSYQKGKREQFVISMLNKMLKILITNKYLNSLSFQYDNVN